jgi:hypothetical protein
VEEGRLKNLVFSNFDMNLISQKLRLNKQIIIFKWIGGTSALIALIPFIWAGVQVLANQSFFKENELGDFIGGTSGTFASFAGLAFIYVGFLGQQLQILMQQEELELNRQEMESTRNEIRGQKKQLKLQNKQFQIQSFETTFFTLISYYDQQLKRVFSEKSSPSGARMNHFKSQILEQVKIEEGDEFVRDKLIHNRREAFQKSFEHMDEDIESILRCVYNVTIHVYKNREFIDEKYFLDVFYRKLSISEINLIYYGLFTGTGYYIPFYEQILVHFLKRVEPNRLYGEDDKRMIKGIPKPDKKLGPHKKIGKIS